MNFNGFDVILIVFVLLFCLAGLRTGFVLSAFCVLGGYLGVYCAKHFSAQLGMNFYLLMALTCAAVIILGFLVKHLTKNFVFGPLDNILGILSGILVGVVFASILMFPIMDKLSWQKQVVVVTSFSGMKVIPQIQKTLPPMKEMSFGRVREMMEEQAQEAKEIAENRIKIEAPGAEDMKKAAVKEKERRRKNNEKIKIRIS